MYCRVPVIIFAIHLIYKTYAIIKILLEYAILHFTLCSALF